MQPEEPSSLTEKDFARGNLPKCIPTSFFDKAPGTHRAICTYPILSLNFGYRMKTATKQ